jgi:solute carrier family 24 (sodium/potassium/calcium exchanger), member 6
MWNLGSTTD